MTITVTSPFSGKRVGEVPSFSRADVVAGVARARAAQPSWAKIPISERTGLLRRFQEALLDERESVARLITEETGKPFVESLGVDVLAALDAIKWVTANGPGALKPQKIRL